MAKFLHIPHPHIAARGALRPKKVADLHHDGPGGWLAVKITALVSTMTCAGLFAVLALIGLPGALKAGLLLTVVWLSSTFLQLVFLPILAVGQKVLGRAADERAEAGWKDVTAVLHECGQLQAHLEHQDMYLTEHVARLAALERQLAPIPIRPPRALPPSRKEPLP